MARVAQLVRASGCGPEGRGFETHLSPQIQKPPHSLLTFYGAATGFMNGENGVMYTVLFAGSTSTSI